MDFRTSARDITLNVNDDGGVVILHVSDESWVKRFTDYLKMIEDKSGEHAEASKDDAAKSIDETVKLAEECKAGFDDIFGAGAYQAVYGCELVGVEYIIEFIEAVMPHIEERMEKRNKMLSKYDVNRTGGAG